jgi:glycosyltransferase involved in cell wall biosynthesis
MLVTCICPTTEARRAWLPQLLSVFESQTWADKELLFIADGPWIEEFCVKPDVRFVIAAGGIGDKRNIGVRFATGEVVCHFDDDDFSAPDRIADQMRRMEETGKAVTGYHTMLFSDGTKWWRYHGIGVFALGTSLCYRRQWALDHPFPSLHVGEDSGFVCYASNARQLASVDAGEHMAASIHAGNTSHRVIASQWLEVLTPPDLRRSSINYSFFHQI